MSFPATSCRRPTSCWSSSALWWLLVVSSLGSAPSGGGSQPSRKRSGQGGK